MKKRKMNEAEKNMIQCAVIITVVGIGLYLLGKPLYYMLICLLLGGIFAVAGIGMYMQNPYDKYGTSAVNEKSEQDEDGEE